MFFPVFLLISVWPSFLFCAEESQRLFIGTFTGGDTGGKGIYTCLLQSQEGRLTEPILVAECDNPSFLAIHPTKARLYAVGSRGQTGLLHAFAYDRKTGMLTLLSEKEIPGRDPCHLVICVSRDQIEETVIIANYGSGNVVSVKVLEDGRIGDVVSNINHSGSGPNPGRQQEPHPHGVYLLDDLETILVPDLGIDRVVAYNIDLKTGQLTKSDKDIDLRLPSGGGPRHLATGNGTLYVNNELTSTVCVFNVKGTEPSRAIQEISTLPEDFERSRNSTSEIELSKSGNFLYVSNRGHDSIAVFAVDKASGKLSSVQFAPCGGVRPRFFCLDPSGEFLISCNNNSCNMTLHAVDQQNGTLTLKPEKVAIGRPVCVVFVPTNN